MSGKESTHKISEISFISDENPYMAAFISLKSDLFIVEELNAVVPKAIKDFASKQETLVGMLNEYFHRLKKGDFAANEIQEFQGKITKKVEVYKKVRQIAMQAKDEIEAKGMKQGYLGFNARTDVGKGFLEELRYSRRFQKRFNAFIRNMSLVYLVALFENYLGKVLQTTMQNKPEILMTSQKSITFEELLKLSDIEDAKGQIIEKEIGAIVNEDLDKLAKYFDDKFNLKLAKNSNWSRFKERFYRRNIIVHNSGYPNKLYRQKTGYKGKNKKMDVSEVYLAQSIKLFDTWALGISAYLSRKFLGDKLQGKHHTDL
jgi:hypothetical protein